MSIVIYIDLGKISQSVMGLLLLLVLVLMVCVSAIASQVSCGENAICSQDPGLSLALFMNEMVMRCDPNKGFYCVCVDGYDWDGFKCTNYCNPNPCLNGGTCLRSEYGFNCTCTNNYSGQYCTAARCGENAVCIYERFKNLGSFGLHVPQMNEWCDERHGYLCVCIIGYEGNGFNCISSCNPNPCLNGGTCTILTERAFQCTCANHYSGQYCTADFCDPNPCLNGGTCSNSEYGFECTCANDYSGQYCTAVRCGENGICIHGPFGEHVPLMNERCDERKDYRCVCDYGYEGDGFNCTEITK